MFSSETQYIFKKSIYSIHAQFIACAVKKCFMISFCWWFTLVHTQLTVTVMQQLSAKYSSWVLNAYTFIAQNVAIFAEKNSKIASFTENTEIQPEKRFREYSMNTLNIHRRCPWIVDNPHFLDSLLHNFFTWGTNSTFFLQYTVKHCPWWLQIGKVKQLFHNRNNVYSCKNKKIKYLKWKQSFQWAHNC